jgi:anhydro-N-acetylmuramic acid kinase
VAWFVGLMSGTSLDGVDGVLAEFEDDGRWARTAAHAHRAMPPRLASELLALARAGENELHHAALAANAVSDLYADVVCDVIARSDIAAGRIRAIGAHGQTVRHRPREFDATGYTLQLINGALLAERTGIDVVCDFRSRDLAAGGLGAPLVPAFHAACFARPGVDRAVLNLGGIANLTLLGGDGSVRGFDCGPGNMLLDLWCQRHCGERFDRGGGWASGGTVIEPLLRRWLAEPFFDQAPPKSTGRELFNSDWLDARLAGGAGSAQDVMATLAELTARSAAQALLRDTPGTREVLVCGGGARNADLMRRLGASLGNGVAVRTTEAEGVAPEQVEALAFAWLAAAFFARRTGSIPAVTGARGARVLGALYPA